mgnify:CR=1 FL=1
MIEFPSVTKFLNELFPIEEDRKTIIHYMRQSIMYPCIAQLPLCLVGTPGCGKSLFIDLFKNILGFYYPGTYSQLQIIDPFRLHSGFTYPWAGRNVVAIEADEIPQCTLDVISEIVEKKEIEVTAKNQHPYMITNTTTWILLSNKTKNFNDFNALHSTIKLGKITPSPLIRETLTINEVPEFTYYLKYF